MWNKTGVNFVCLTEKSGGGVPGGFVVSVDEQVGLFVCLHCQLVAAFVAGVVGMSLDPDEAHAVPAVDEEEAFPQVGVFFVFECFLFPAEDPSFFDGVHDIAGVGVDGDLHVGVAQGFQPEDDGEEFHAVVGGFPEPEREFLAVGACDEEDAQTSRSGVPACRSVGVYRDGCHGLFLRV